MEQVANKNCRSLVEDRKEFNGSNLYARKIGKLYVVYSYGEHYPMFLFRKGWWYENKDGFSRSTGKHHSQARPHYSRNISRTLTTKDLQNIIRREESRHE